MNNISLTKKSLFIKFSHGVILNVLLKLKGLLYIPLIVNYLTKDSLGEISYVQAFGTLLTGLMLLNIPDSSNRLILDQQDFKNQRLVINTITNFSFLFGIGFILTFILISLSFSLVDTRIVLVVSTILLSSLLDKLSKFVFQIFQNTKLLVTVIVMTEYVSLLIVWLVIKYNLNSDVLDILYIYNFVLLSSSLFFFRKLYKQYSFQLVINGQILKRVLKISLFLFPASYNMVMLQSADVLMIKNFLDLKSLGEYGFSYSIAGIVNGLSMAVTFFWYSSAVSADKSKMKELIKVIMKTAFFGFLIVVVGYFAITNTLIEFINSDYLATKNIIMILVVGFFVNILNQVYQGVMYADGNEKRILVDTFISVFMNIMINLICLQRYGIIVAAFANSFSMITLFVLRTLYFRKKYEIKVNDSIVKYSVLIVTFSLSTILYYLWI